MFMHLQPLHLCNPRTKTSQPPYPTPSHGTHCHVGNPMKPHWSITNDKKLRVEIDLLVCLRKSKTSRHVKRGRDTKIPQSSGPTVKVGDEAVHKELGDRIERAATTASSLEAEQDSDAQTWFEAASEQFNDPPLSRGYTLGSREDTTAAGLLNAVRHTMVLSFWATAKAKTVNGERQLQALVDKKRVIITESSIRSDLHLEDAGGIDCLPTATIFEELARMGYEKPSQRLTFYKAFFSPQWKFLIHTITQCLSAKSTVWNEFNSTMASVIICLATNQKFNFSKYIFDAMVKHLEGGVKFLIYPRFVQVFINQQLGDMSHHKNIYVNPSHTKKIFANMMVQATQDEGVDSCIPTDSQQTPITNQPSSSRPQKKQSRRKQRKETEVPQDETHHDDSVLDLEKAKDAQAKEIAGLKKRVQKLERKKKSRTTGLKRLRKVGESRRVSSSKDKDSLGAQEDASKQGRIFKGIDKDIEVSLVDETHGRSDEVEMFDTDDLHGDEVIVDMVVGEKQEQSAKVDEREVSTGVEDSVAPTIPVTTAATTTTTIRPKARGVVVQEPSEFRTTTSSLQASQPLKTKDKGKAIMIEPKVPLKKKDQVVLHEEMTRNLEAQLQAKLIEEGKMARKKEEESNIALIESWENTKAMMEAARLLAERLQTREQKELTDEEKAKLFMEFMEKRRKHFAALRAKQKRNRPPTETQKRNQMSIYLKHMGRYKHNQLKGRSYDEIQKLFDKEMKRVNSFVAMNLEAQEISGKKDENKSDKSKKQKTNENEEVEVDNEVELKKHMVLVKDDDIAIDAIPLATKSPVIVEYNLIKEGILGHYQLIRANGSSKRYSSMIRILQGINREDLETLWKLVKTKHGDTRPEDKHERVLWGDLKVMFEPDIKSDVWRNLQGYKVTVWKLFDSCGVHFIRI
ncbi:hypothetical protein Tco_1272223 [Tanacetum coccineum]